MTTENNKLRNGVLNPVVLKVLEENRELRVLWLLGRRIDLVDSDIDPIHNPSWCKDRMRHEAKVLAHLISEIELLDFESEQQQ